MPRNTNQKCHIIWDTVAYKVTCPYQPAFIELLKATIPVGKRAYDPDTKIWSFDESYFDSIKFAAEKCFPGGVICDTKQEVEAREQQKKASAPTAAKAPFSVVLQEFVGMLPKDALIAAYRRAAMELHPDKQGGSSDKMSQLNMLWERIKTEKLI